jgi:hypothetical protein
MSFVKFIPSLSKGEKQICFLTGLTTEMVEGTPGIIRGIGKNSTVSFFSKISVSIMI